MIGERTLQFFWMVMHAFRLQEVLVTIRFCFVWKASRQRQRWAAIKKEYEKSQAILKEAENL